MSQDVAVPDIVAIIRATDLSPMERVFLADVRWRQGRNGVAWATQAVYAEDIGTTDRHVRRLTDSLVAKGWLTAERKGKLVRLAVLSPISETGRPGPVCPPPDDDGNRTPRSGLEGSETGRPGPVKPDGAVRVNRTPRSGDNRKRKETERKEKGAALSPSFCLYWGAYPQTHRGDPDETLKAWQAAVAADDPEGVAAEILTSLRAWTSSTDWAEDDGAWIPSSASFLTRGKWKQRPKNFTRGPDPKPCYSCHGPSANYTRDDGGFATWFCRRCQPNTKGKLERDLPLQPAIAGGVR